MEYEKMKVIRAELEKGEIYTVRSRKEWTERIRSSKERNDEAEDLP